MPIFRLVTLILLLAHNSIHAVDLTSNPISQKNVYLLAQNLPNDSFDRTIRDRRKIAQGTKNKDPWNTQATSQQQGQTSDAGLTVCAGEFALCASSTCTPTGRLIKVNENNGKSTREFKESSCKCPVITAEIAQQNGAPLTALAAVNEGNMKGSCSTSGPDKVWAIYSPTIYEYPQESTTPPFRTALANRQICPAGSIGSNCWNFECTIDKEKTNGARTATCYCPIGESYIGHKAPPNAGLGTEAGGYYNPPTKACSMYPVSGPVPANL